MSTQAISDYITKQIFIEKNIVTYRLLSRQFSLHVNAAKNELATYHHNAPYQSQNSCATFLISGTMGRIDSSQKDSYEDVDMDQSQNSDNVEQDGSEEEDSDAVSQTTVLLVNEKDLEGAKAKYDVIDSIYVYSLAPAPLIDSALICNCAESVKSIDRSKGAEWAAVVGRVVLSGIKTGPPKKGKLQVAPVAGPSKSKPTPAPEPAMVKPEPVKTEVKMKQGTSSASTSDKPKEKKNGTGKLNFFTKAKDRKDVRPPEDVKKVKKEESVTDLNKKMFFSKPAESTASGANVKAEKKPSSRDDAKTKTNTGGESLTAAPTTMARRKGKFILSDEESDEAPASHRKSRASVKSESSFGMDSEAEREARALMDLDDDQVERVSHAPSTAVSELEDQSETDSAFVKVEQDDEDVDMADEPTVQIRPKKRKAKTTIPVGRNGLKKRKVVRTKSQKDDNGYIHKEDYTDWESVDDEEPEPKKKVKAKTKATTVKKEATEEKLPSATPEEAKQKDNEAARKPAAPRTRTKNNVRTQKGLMNFFGPSKKT